MEATRYSALEQRVLAALCCRAPAARTQASPLLFENCVRRCLQYDSRYPVVFQEGGNDELEAVVPDSGISLAYCKANSSAGSTSRDWQLEALERGELSAVCPWSGARVVTRWSIIAARNQPIFYPFIAADGSGRLFWLVAGREGTGADRLYLFFPDSGLVVMLTERRFWNGRGEIDQMRAFLIARWREIVGYFGSGATRPWVLLDSRHFAHHLWEEVTGLEKLLEGDTWKRAAGAIVAAEPICAPEILFPEIAGSWWCREDFATAPSSMYEARRFLIRVNATRIQETVLERVVRAAEAVSDPGVVEAVEDFADSHSPIFWCSLRVNDRTWVSQESGLAEIINRLRRLYPRLGVVVDGFCIPHGSPRVAESEQRRLVALELSALNRLLAQLDCREGVVALSGRSIAESLLFARCADFYFCHHGSLQHKISWIANIAGVVHSTREVCEKAPLGHDGLYGRVDAVLPTYLPAKAIRACAGAEEVRDNKWDDDRGNYDFEIEAAWCLIRELGSAD